MPDPDDADDDVSSLLASRFQRSRPAPRPGPDHPPPVRADAPAALPDLDGPRSPPEPVTRTADEATAIIGRERFLPVAEPMLVPAVEPGPIRIFVPVGTAVHVIEDGRIVDVEQHIAGEVTVRVDGDRFYRYRRLLPSSISVAAGEPVDPGTLIGTVGDAIDDDPPCLVVGLQAGDGEWLDICAELTGLADPGELGVHLSTHGDEWIDPLAADGSLSDSSEAVK